MSKKDDFIDDGRTVADMSGIERTPLILPKIHSSKKQENNNEKEEAPWEDNGFNRQERRAFISGTLTAALLVASIFAIAGAAVIFLITRM